MHAANMASRSNALGSTMSCTLSPCRRACNMAAAISGVARLITVDNVVRALRLTDRTMRASGFNPPRIAVAGLNPHAGDNGNFGR